MIDVPDAELERVPDLLKRTNELNFEKRFHGERLFLATGVNQFAGPVVWVPDRAYGRGSSESTR
ncbi:hypothetical protein [Micromonospora profundi]|uniref:hypothetical protein n=1 Tax=Micromonospora profundi TaxID=1420889 RepID=UPI00364768CF